MYTAHNLTGHPATDILARSDEAATAYYPAAKALRAGLAEWITDGTDNGAYGLVPAGETDPAAALVVVWGPDHAGVIDDADLAVLTQLGHLADAFPA